MISGRGHQHDKWSDVKVMPLKKNMEQKKFGDSLEYTQNKN